MIITRKIKLNYADESKEARKEAATRLFGLRNIAVKSANIAATHLYLQEQMKQFIYLQENVKVKLANFANDPDGILNTSYQNSIYRVLSDNFKGKIPTTILSMVAQNVFRNFKEEKSDYYRGVKSLRSYKNTMPIPFEKKHFKLLPETDEYDNVYFELYGIKLKTYFGKDRSDNKVIVNRALTEEYKLRQSSIKIQDKIGGGYEVYLLLSVDIPTKETDLKDKELSCSLSPDVPVQVALNSKTYNIGSKEAFLYKRLQIQNKLAHAQKTAKFNTGGKGRKKKVKNIERFKEKEKNFVKTELHKYSHELVKTALKEQCNTIVLESQLEKETEAKKSHAEGDVFILRNWGYYGFKELIKYKAEMHSINVVER